MWAAEESGTELRGGLGVPLATPRPWHSLLQLPFYFPSAALGNTCQHPAPLSHWAAKAVASRLHPARRLVPNRCSANTKSGREWTSPRGQARTCRAPMHLWPLPENPSAGTPSSQVAPLTLLLRAASAHPAGGSCLHTTPLPAAPSQHGQNCLLPLSHQLPIWDPQPLAQEVHSRCSKMEMLMSLTTVNLLQTMSCWGCNWKWSPCDGCVF